MKLDAVAKEGNRRVSCSFAAIVACLAMLASGGAAAQARQQIRVAGAGAGGLFYLVAGGMVNALNKHSNLVQATLQATSGGVENARLLESGQVDLALLPEDTADHGWRGVDEFKQPARNLRLVFKGHPTVYTFVTLARSDIRSLQDIRGKLVTFGPPASGGAVLGERVLAEIGLKGGADYRPQVMAYAQQNDALRDGRIHVAFTGGQIPIPQLIELGASTPIRFLPIPADIAQRIQSKHGKFYQPTVVPANSFKGQDADVPAINVGFSNTGVRAGLPDAIVQEIARVLTEHNDEIVAVHPMGKWYTAREAFSGGATYIPFHPGAVAYLKKIGLWDKRPAGAMEPPQ